MDNLNMNGSGTILSTTEKNQRTNGILAIAALVVGAIGVIIAAVALVLTLTKVSDLERRIGVTSGGSPASPAAPTVQPGDYAIDVEVFDGFVPGNTYHVTLDAATRLLTIETQPGCSMADTASCPSNSTTLRTLTSDEYSLVTRTYQALAAEGSDAGLMTWIYALTSLMDGGNIYGSSEYDDWAEISEQDLNGDGIVTGQEFAIYNLNQILGDSD